MTQDEIIEMAIKLGAGCYTPPPTTLVKGITMTFDQLETFTKLVDSKATAKEREECAKVAESFGKYESDVAQAIRARGEA